MDGRITLDGFIKDLRVQEPAHPDFANAAISAVSQWQWDSTLLNRVPVEVGDHGDGQVHQSTVEVLIPTLL